MTRYFYRGPLAPAWMVDHHGLLVVEESGRIHCESETILDSHVEDCYRGKYFVHADSLKLLEPRNGDIVAGTYQQGGEDYPMAGIIFVSRPAFSSEPIVDLVWTESDYPHAYQGEPIIQRDGNAFHWPESEAA